MNARPRSSPCHSSPDSVKAAAAAPPTICLLFKRLATETLFPCGCSSTLRTSRSLLPCKLHCDGLIQSGTERRGSCAICRMTDHASHGDASPECTRTLYVLWGAGVSSSPDSLCSNGAAHTASWRNGDTNDETSAYSSRVWAMGSPLRADVHQAQFAPLMSALLGVATPTNAMFVLPDHLLADEVPGMARGEFAAQVRASII